MATIQLSEINIYPIKSLAGIRLSSAFVAQSGISFDRRFMLCTPDGELLSARQEPSLLQYQAVLRQDGLEVIAPDGDHITLRYPELFQNYRQVWVWGNEINAQLCGEQFDQWFSNKLDRECQLLFFGEQSERYTSRAPETPVAFADGYPLLIISEASLKELNRRSSSEITMDQFRSNLVIQNCTPFEEDSWKRIRIGEVEFEIVKPCSRCNMTTFDPETGKKLPAGEPIKTLANFRRGKDNEVYFGQNLIPLNEGQIQYGDTLEVLETQLPEIYPDNAPLVRELQAAPSKQQWQSSQPIELHCVSRVEETRDVATFRFALPENLHLQYFAGQFITLLLNIDGTPVSRCYTLSSSPSRSADIAITVKRVTEGTVSNWLHHNIQPGDRINALAPQGLFHEGNCGDAALLLLSAGSGITPMLSIARQLSDTHSQRDIIFYHQARTESDLICEDELLWLERQNPRLKLIFSLSQPEADWQGVKGRINRNQLIELIPDLAERTVLCCGPEGFMKHAREYCQELGVDDSQWFEESFGSPPGIDSSADIKSLTLILNGHAVNGDNQRNLLEQAESKGVVIAFGCRSGVCGACKVKLLKGSVHRSSEIPLSEDEKDQGLILACSCVPESDIEVAL